MPTNPKILKVSACLNKIVPMRYIPVINPALTTDGEASVMMMYKPSAIINNRATLMNFKCEIESSILSNQPDKPCNEIVMCNPETAKTCAALI